MGRHVRELAPRTDGAAGAAPARADVDLDALRPMLATLGSLDELQGGDEDAWAFEMKWDGMRVLVHVADGRVRLVTRNGRDVSATYPDLAEAARAVGPRSAVLDAELVALDRHDVPDFGLLQQRMNLTKPAEVERAAGEIRVALEVFDVLAVDGDETMSLDYVARRDVLARIVHDDPSVGVRVPEAFHGDVDGAVARSRALGLEGVMAKRRDSRYHSGRRTTDWLKLPRVDAADVVVVGWRPSEAEPDGIASVLVAAPDGADGRLAYVGRVGTGFSADDRVAIRRELERIERATPPVDVPRAEARDAHWVTPERVAEVRFRERTEQGRLRHPRWRGWRPDKAAADLQPIGV